MTTLLRFPFRFACEASWQAAVIVALVLTISAIFGRRIAPRWRCALWLIVFVRLILPSLPPSPISVFNLRSGDRDVESRAPVTTISLVLPGVPPPTPVSSTRRPIPMHYPAPWNWIDVAAIAWASVAALLLLRQAISLALLARRLRSLPDTTDAQLIALVETTARTMHIACPRIVEVDRIASPALAGILRPVLLMPLGIADALTPHELATVIRHELAHIRRRDLLIGLFATCAACLHWFNPLIWLAVVRFRAERELACDDAVLRGGVDRGAYGRTILKLLDMFPPMGRRMSGAIGMLGSRRAVHRRIAAIASSPARPWPLLGAILFLALGCATLSGPRKKTGAASANPPGTITRSYGINDLLGQPPDFRAPNLGVQVATTQPATTQPQDASHAKTADELIARITRSIDPPSWHTNGGKLGSIAEDAAMLVITQTPANHAGVEKMLREIRGLHGVQVTVESRFLYAFPNDGLPGSEQKWTRPDNGDVELWADLLSNADVKRILTAQGNNERSSMVTAPRITMFDGQRAYVTVARESAYVAGFAAKGPGFEPTIGTLRSGIQLDCRVKVSADHKNVTLDLHPQQTALLGFTPQRWPGSAPGDERLIQVPQVKTCEMERTITLPDGASALFRLRTKTTATTTQPSPPEETVLLLVRPTVTEENATTKPIDPGLISPRPALE